MDLIMDKECAVQDLSSMQFKSEIFTWIYDEVKNECDITRVAHKSIFSSVVSPTLTLKAS